MSVLSAFLGDQPAEGPKTVMAEMPVVLQTARDHRAKQKSPQQRLDEFWRRFTTEAPGKATSVIPQNKTAAKAAKGRTNVKSSVGTTTRSYEEAAELCRAKVEKIVKECRRINQKYRDPHFDLEFDLKMERGDCLNGLDNAVVEDSSGDEGGPGRGRRGRRGRGGRGDGGGGGDTGREKGVGKEDEKGVDKGEEMDGKKGRGRTDGMFRPKAVKRVGEIFDEPTFYIDGPTANDVRQGRDGDCWLMAALCTLSNKPGLIERCCVARDEAVGVYGFVFHRDGEWISEIIDDKLYLTKGDYDEVNYERLLWEDRDRINSEEQYRKTYQSNSGALYFAQCENPNETWLPLLEKAYAKAHGDYAAIEGGFTGEGIEDLTGGVTSELFTTDILDKEYFWTQEIMKVNSQFLFGCSTGIWGRGFGERKGIMELHAYSLMRAIEMDGERLVLLKNPWGKGEWKGAWSDGSKEWTPEWLNKLGHRFGDDGAFWISYDDLLRKYQAFDRTRLFGPEWKVTSIWTTLSVPWTLEYLDTKFAFTLSRPGPVVLVMSQLDDRYFRGLEGQYRFELSFRLHVAGEEDYVVRSQTTYRMNRSVNVELELEPGEYHVLVKIDATRDNTVMPAEDVVRANAKDRREKLIRIGLAYDVAHSKGKIIESAEEKAAREAYEKRKREKEKKELKDRIMKERRKDHYIQSKRLARNRKRMEKQRAKQKAKEEKMRAEEERLMAEQGPPPPQPGMGRGKRRDKNVAGKKDAQVQTEEKVEVKTEPGSSKGAESVANEADKNEKQAELSPPGTAEDDTVKDGESSAQGENTPSATCSEKSSDDTLKPSSNETEAKTVTAEEKPSNAVPEEGDKETETKPEPATETKPSKEPQPSLSREETFHTAPQSSPSPQSSCPPSDSEYASSHPPPPPRQSRHRGPPPPHPGHRNPPPPPPGAFIPRRGGPQGGYLSDDSMSSISSPSDISDRELEILFDDNKLIAARRPPPPPMPPPVGRSVVDSEDEEVERDPWNAVAVVGLRVYYRVEEDDKEEEVVKIRVIRPNYFSIGGGDEGKKEEEKGGKDGVDESTVLDLDDSAKDATLEGGEKEHIVEEIKEEDGEKKEGVVSKEVSFKEEKDERQEEKKDESKDETKEEQKEEKKEWKKE